MAQYKIGLNVEPERAEKLAEMIRKDWPEFTVEVFPDEDDAVVVTADASNGEMAQAIAIQMDAYEAVNGYKVDIVESAAHPV